MVDEASNADDLLLTYLRHRDQTCPVCRYNLRDLSRVVCPECNQQLALTVGAPNIRFEWFIALVTPGLFSGIAAFLLLIPIILSMTESPPSPAPWFIVATDGFGWLSGSVTLVLISRYRLRFIRLPLAAQQRLAALAWAIHLGAFLMLLFVILG